MPNYGATIFYVEDLNDILKKLDFLYKAEDLHTRK